MARQAPPAETKAADAFMNDLQDEDYDEKVLKKRQRQIAVKICCDLFLFFVFLMSFTVVVLLAQSIQSALMVSRVKNLMRQTA